MSRGGQAASAADDSYRKEPTKREIEGRIAGVRRRLYDRLFVHRYGLRGAGTDEIVS